MKFEGNIVVTLDARDKYDAQDKLDAMAKAVEGIFFRDVTYITTENVEAEDTWRQLTV